MTSHEETRTEIRGKKVKKSLIFLTIAMAILILGPRLLIHARTSSRITSNTADVPNCDVGIVLGAKIFPSGALSQVLRDRVNKGIELYKAGKVKKLLMSGDNRVSHYNEPQRMAEYAIRAGVSPRDIATDFAGRRTYDSLYRAKHIFGLDDVVIVSQRCHVERALFIADAVGVRAHGLAADIPKHSREYGDVKMAIREFPACLAVLVDLYVRHPRVVMGSKEKI